MFAPLLHLIIQCRNFLRAIIGNGLAWVLSVPATVSDDASLSSISVKGTLLHALAFGHPDNPLVIVLHDGPGKDMCNLLHFADLAPQGLRVVCYDQSGSGLSQRFESEYYQPHPTKVMAEEVLGVIGHYRTHPHQEVILVGHGWGALIAEQVIQSNPQLVHGLVCWDNPDPFFLSIATTPSENHRIADAKLALKANQHKGDLIGRYGAAVHAVGRKEWNSTSLTSSIPLTLPVLIIASRDKSYKHQLPQSINAPSAHYVHITGTCHKSAEFKRTEWEQCLRPEIISFIHYAILSATHNSNSHDKQSNTTTT